MKAFKNVTNQGNEPAVKKAVNLPENSINLGWFNSGEITPEMHLSVSDLSGLIPENAVPVSTSEIDTAMYADEFGVLRYLKANQEMNQQFGSPIVANSEVSISNYILNKKQKDIDFNYTGRVPDLESEMFIHSYYVSNHFALLDSSVSNYRGMEKSSELREPAKAGIQVVDLSGNNLVDSNGKNNYKIILQKYTNHRSIVELSGTIYQGLDLYRIIILLEQVNPQDLYLIYNKYEKNEDNIPYNPFFGYKEKINTISYYKYVVEESEVVDPSSSERKIYSTQLFSYKENKLLKNKISNDGWKVYAPRKAIQDPRTFQSFNWRLLAKITYNYANVRNVYAESERATLKVGVLYSGEISQVKNAYVFANMEESVFNLQNYLFENPIAASTNNKSQKNYWLVNIDDNTIDYSKFDILVWTPIQAVTELQGNTINRALSLNASVFIDASLISAGFSYLGIDLSIDGTYTSTGFLTVQDTYKNGNNTMNAWDISEYHESSTIPRYSIFGKRKDVLNNDSIFSLRTFNGIPSTQSSSVALVSVDSKAVIVKRSTVTGNILPSSLVISANPFLYLVNDTMKGDSSHTLNNGETNAFAVGTVGNQTSAVSTLVIGPNKFFYNYLSDVNKNKVNNYATNNTINQSTILWNVSPWRNLWTINGAVKNGQVTVLSELEKQEYNFSFKNAIGSTEQKFCTEISPSISGILLRDFEGTLNGQDAESIINADFSNVEFYLECTNPNVKFLNFTDYNSTLSAGGDTLLGQANSSYKIFKLDTQAFNQIKANPPSAVSLNAYSVVSSNEFDFSNISYPYAIIGSSEYNSRTDSGIKTPTDFLPGSQDVRDYNFAFKTSISINEITKTFNTYKINWSTGFRSAIGGSADFKNVVFKPGKNTNGITRSNFSISEVEENKIQIKQTFSPFNKYYYPGKVFSKTDIVSADQETTASTFNNFHYTGDIDIGNQWDEYMLGEGVIPLIKTLVKGIKVVKKDVLQILNDPYFTWENYFNGEVFGDLRTFKPGEWTVLVPNPILWSSPLFNGSNKSCTEFDLIFKPWAVSLAKFIMYTSEPLNNLYRNWEDYLNTSTKDSIAEAFITEYPNLYFAKNSKISVAGGNKKVQDYTKYIQYTLLKNGYKLNVDGMYGQQTHATVRLFQISKDLGFIDGIVDSETKSVLATFWLKLFRENINKFKSLREEAPDGSKKYIDAAVRYSDISKIGVPGHEYRRISFTGVPGPTVLEDYIFFKVPQKASDQLLHSVTIFTGEWAVDLGEIEVFTSDLDIQKFYQRKKERVSIPGISPSFVVDVNKVVRGGDVKTIKLDSASPNAKWVGIRMYSTKINDSKFGPNAEGFSIRNIQFGISSPDTHIDPVYGGTSNFEGTAYGTIAGYTQIQSPDEALIDFSTISNMISSTVSNITSINLSKIDFTMSQTVEGSTQTKTVSQVISSSEILRYSSTTNKLMDKISFKYEDIDVEIGGEHNNGLSHTLSLYDISPSIVSSFKLNGTAAPTSISNGDFSLTQVPGRSNFYILKTILGVGYESKETSPKVTVSNYFITDADNLSSSQNTKNTINVRDGIVVLTGSTTLPNGTLVSTGLPTGFPNFNSYVTTDSVTNFGFLNLIWSYSSPAPYGLDWGFYNVSTKKFLGKKISYFEYMNQPGLTEGTRGPNNVFIGLNAFDSDMDRGTQDNIVGTTVRAPQSEANRPTRYICPLYSVKVKSRSKIKVSSPPKALNKFDTWFVNVGVGKFIKNITMPSNYIFTNWMKEYTGKTLKCYYDTTQIKTPISSIFGHGHYDIHDEHPQIISDNTISLRYGSVHCAQEQYDINLYSNDDYTDASPISPWIFVTIKNAKGKWINIPRKEIKDFDKNTGRITFKKEIVPVNSKDIKVSYTIKSPDLMVHQINGEMIPLNPFLAAEDNSPIFMYLLPIRCEILVPEVGIYETPSGFVSDDPLKFTRDSTIFNPISTKYNPLALHISTINVNNKYTFENVSIEDMRIKGGGLKYSVDITKEFAEDLDIASYSDIYTGMSFLHPNGGYVILQIPQEVMSNFNSRDEIYSIVRNNLTAGVSFDIQDVDGIDWRSIYEAQ